MCGITVVLRADACRNEVVNNLTAMQGLQRHRGPDGAGTVIEELGDGRVLGLGHQRLAVLDLSNSATQPMMSPCWPLSSWLILQGASQLSAIKRVSMDRWPHS